MSALLGSGTLILDVVAGDAGLDEATDQVAHMRIAAVAGVGVGDDERPVVDSGGGGALLVGHLQPQVLLVAVGGQQRAHQARRLVGHLAQRVAGEVRARILVGGAFGRRRPAAQVDALDTAALHRHRLAGGVRPECGDRLALTEQFAQPGVEGDGGLARHGVVDSDGAALLNDLACGVEPGDAGEARAVEVPLGLGHLVVDISHGCCVSFDDGHCCHAPRDALCLVLSAITRYWR